MKKLFFFLSLALCVVLTGCQDDNKVVVPEEGRDPVENSGDDNIAYTYYQGTKALCGQTMDDAAAHLQELKMQPMSEFVFALDNGDYSVYVALGDEDDDKYVDILSVSIEPSEKKDHKVLMTQEAVLEFAGLVGAEDKMLAKDVKCPFYGLFDKAGEQIVPASQFKDFVAGKAVDAEHLNGGYALWLDETIKEFKLDAENPQPFTGMVMSPIQIEGDEYILHFAFVNNQIIVE